MKGRIYTFQDHPYEGPTNYVGLTCLRCNLDVQDLRRVLVDFASASLPSAGPKDNWSWMSVDAPTSDFDFESCDWPKVCDELVDLEEKIGTCVSAHAISSLSGNVPDEDLNAKARKSIFNGHKRSQACALRGLLVQQSELEDTVNLSNLIHS